MAAPLVLPLKPAKTFMRQSTVNAWRLNSVGVMDASTVKSRSMASMPANFNRIYSNALSGFEPGKCRYGRYQDGNGMVMDDGVTACVSEQQFYMTTTTGGAARVLSWLELWHQSEWPELKVWMTSVTDHWGTIAWFTRKPAKCCKSCATTLISAPKPSRLWNGKPAR